MDMTEDDYDRLSFFDQARKLAEANYETNPHDADNLMRWAGALLELSQYQTVAGSEKMIKDAISKLEEALLVSPKKPEALWCLGNAHTSIGFLTREFDVAKVSFEIASLYFMQAAEEEPNNELYLKSIQMNAKAPELHTEIHQNVIHQNVLGEQLMGGGGGGSSGSSNPEASKEPKNNDLTYDIYGWIIFGIGICAWIGITMERSQVPPPPSG